VAEIAGEPLGTGLTAPVAECRGYGGCRDASAILVVPTVRGCRGDDAQRRAGEGAHGALEKKREGLTATSGSTLQPRCREPIGTLSMGVCIRPAFAPAVGRRHHSGSDRLRGLPPQPCRLPGARAPTPPTIARLPEGHDPSNKELVTITAPVSDDWSALELPSSPTESRTEPPIFSAASAGRTAPQPHARA
jgi:hypothetical protein